MLLIIMICESLGFVLSDSAEISDSVHWQEWNLPRAPVLYNKQFIWSDGGFVGQVPFPLHLGVHTCMYVCMFVRVRTFQQVYILQCIILMTIHTYTSSDNSTQSVYCVNSSVRSYHVLCMLWINLLWFEFEKSLLYFSLMII